MKKAISSILLPILPMLVAYCSPTATLVKGDLYKARKENPPGVILLHGWIRPGRPWHDLCWRLQKEGYTAYAPDLPQVSVSKMLKIVEEHFQYLVTQGVDPNRLALIGESTGANTALWYAGKDPKIKTIILLSPGYGYHIPLSATEIRRYGNRPILIITSRYDTEYAYSARDSENLLMHAKGQKELKLAPGGHGIGMFDSKVFDWIISWLRETL